MKFTAVVVAKFDVAEKSGHLVFLHKNRETLAGFWRHDLLHGVAFEQTAFFQKAEIRLETRQAAIDAAGTLSALHLGNYPRSDMQMPHFGDRGKALLLRTMSNKIL